MNSSTSSFRQELKVLAVIATVLIGCEIFFRVAWPALDAEEAGPIKALAQQASNLQAAKGPGVLILGNSLVLYGLAETDIEARLVPAAGAVHCESVALHGAGIIEWRRLLQHHFIETGGHPDVLVIVSMARGLRDASSCKVERLAMYCSPATWGAIFREDLPEFGRQATFVHSHVFASFAYSTRVRRFVLGNIIPHFKAQRRRIHAGQVARDAAKQSPQPPTHDRLASLLQLSADNDIRTILLFMPTREPYAIPQPLTDLAGELGATVLDYRELQGITSGHFIDADHMTDEGAGIFVDAFARDLTTAIRDATAGTRIKTGR